MLYVYRPSQLYGGGLYYDVHIDKELMGTLKNGAFLEKELPAGTYEIWAETEAKRNIDVTLEPATVTCIRGGVTLGFMVGRPTFSPVPLNQCTEELAGTARPE